MCSESSGSVAKVHEAIGNLEKKLKSHQGEYRVPFIAKIKAFEGADALIVNLSDSNGFQSSDQLKYYADKDGKKMLKNVTSS